MGYTTDAHATHATKRAICTVSFVQHAVICMPHAAVVLVSAAQPKWR